MKLKLVALIAGILLSTSIIANGHEGYRGGYHGGYEHHHGGNSWGWVAPMAIGGIIGYELNQPRVIVQQPLPPPIVYQQQPSYAGCPSPYQPYYNLIWARDSYGNYVQQQQFAGCH